jgi:hypothetical protein
MEKGRRHFIKNSAMAGTALLVLPSLAFADENVLSFNSVAENSKKDYLCLDMVHHNPGMAKTESKFLNPDFLKSYGYGAKVFFLFEAAQFGIDWQSFDAPPGSEGLHWVTEKKAQLTAEYNKTKTAGLDVYCMLDMLVFPTALVNKYKAEMCNSAGKIDISLPFTQKAVTALLEQMFSKFPQLDGLVIRTGETYLQDAPYYTGGTPVVNGMDDHVTLLNLLREEVCVKRNKKIFYRTWDISRLHALPKYYLQVSGQIAPHDNLYFSIKHTMVDFWRGAIDKKRPDYGSFDSYWIDEASKYGVPFNPCLGIGKHKQIVEVQCQREYEGKAAHPNYIAKGVIDRFSELKELPAPQSLNELKKSALFAGVWTWSRGGGWGGPYAKSEFWPELNAFVIAQWAKHPERKERDIFKDFCRMKGVHDGQVADFHKLCLLSEAGILKGQYSAMGNVYVNWTRDDRAFGTHFLDSSFTYAVGNNLAGSYIEEKQEAVAIWKEIMELSHKVNFADAADTAFVRASCEYGFLKFSFFAAAWKVMLTYYAQKAAGGTKAEVLKPLLDDYDTKWKLWEYFTKVNPYSPTLYVLKADFFGKQVGLKNAIDTMRS